MMNGNRRVAAALALVLVATSGCSHLRPPQEDSAALGNATHLKPACEYENVLLDVLECLVNHPN